MKSCLTGIFLLFCSVVYCQQLSGIVKDETGLPVADATVTLVRGRDTAGIRNTVTDTAGKFVLTDIPGGEFILRVSHIGYAVLSSGAIVVKGKLPVSLPPFVLSSSSSNLSQVVVSQRKPTIEVKADRIVLNVQNSATASGQNALDLLRRSPGVVLDKDNNISMNGKGGVQVFIDGKPTPLSGTDLSDYLASIQASGVEAIEVIYNPSAKFEAAGNAGIINIRLTKNKTYGNNAYVNGGYNIGVHSRYNGGLSINHRDKLLNVYGNYNISHLTNEGYLDFNRQQLDTLFDQTSSILTHSTTHNMKAGLDYVAGKNSTLGIMATGFLSKVTTQTNSVTPISYIPDNHLVKRLQAGNASDNKRNNGNFNLNYRYADTAGHELNIDADYGIYRIKGKQVQPNVYYDSTGKYILSSNSYLLQSPTDIDIYSLKADRTDRLCGGQLETGAKVSYVRSNNNFQQYSVYPTGDAFDSLHSNNFLYKENINAVYATYLRTLKRLSFQAGLRVENTNVSGLSTGFKAETNQYSPYDSSFRLHYTNFFPSGSFTFGDQKASQWMVSYSYRIDRPAYRDLNPFQFRLDDYTIREGNTQLKPQYTHSTALTYSYRQQLTASLGYSHISDLFTTLTDTIDKSKSVLKRINLASQNITSLNLSYPFQSGWYSAFADVSAAYSIYKANFGPGRTINLNAFSVNMNLDQTVRLGSGWAGELTAFYNSPAILQGTFRSKALWSVDGALQKSVLGKKGSISAGVSDIFKSLKYSATSDFAGQHLFARGGSETRLFKISFTYRLGSSSVKNARQRRSGAEEEGKRTNN